MSETAKPTNFIAAMLHYFGKLPNETTVEFGQEIKSLTDQDRGEFRDMLIGQGYPLLVSSDPRRA